MLKAIKLYPKFTMSVKVKDMHEAEHINKTVQHMYIHLRQQEYEIKVTRSKRTLRPFDFEITFYELKTLKEMIDDKLYELGETYE